MAESIIKGYIPILAKEKGTEQTLLDLSKNLSVQFGDLVADLEKRSMQSEEKFKAELEKGTSIIIDKLEKFEFAYVSLEQELLFTICEARTVPMVENFFEGCQTFRIFLNEGLDYALRRQLISVEQILSCEPHIFISIPRISVLYACYNGMFPKRSTRPGFTEFSFYSNPFFQSIYTKLSKLQDKIDDMPVMHSFVLERKLVCDLNEECDEENEASSDILMKQVFLEVSEIAHSIQTGSAKIYREIFSVMIKNLEKREIVKDKPKSKTFFHKIFG
jgi:hypothetical protein